MTYSQEHWRDKWEVGRKVLELVVIGKRMEITFVPSYVVTLVMRELCQIRHGRTPCFAMVGINQVQVRDFGECKRRLEEFKWYLARLNE